VHLLLVLHRDARGEAGDVRRQASDVRAGAEIDARWW
jgi:hypothetical protein